MPCEHYKDALIEAAATGAEPQGELRAHLDACASCRAALEQEQSLFASIDAGLRASANDEVPVSLLPRVRAAIADSPAATPRRLPGFAFAAATAAFVLAVLFAPRPHQPSPNNQTNQADSIPRPLPPSVSTESPRLAPALAASANPHASRPRVSAPVQRFHASEPEVIVSAEEREGYALLLATLQQRLDVSRALATTIHEKQEPTDGAMPLEIAQLEITPLENPEASASNRAKK